MESFSFTLPGKPLAKKPPRLGNRRAYNQQRREMDTYKALLLSLELPDGYPLDQCSVTVEARFRPPISKRNRIGKPHIQRPDCDNIQKMLGDIGNGIIWKDDAVIHTLQVKKVWAERDETVITVQTHEGI